MAPERIGKWIKWFEKLSTMFEQRMNVRCFVQACRT